MTAVVWGLMGIGLLAGVPASAWDYDPLAGPEAVEIQSMDLIVRDEAREREIPLRVYLPGTKDPAPIVLFSHGLGGTCKGCAYLGRHWAARGYAAVFLQHPGSDDGVWKGQPLSKRMAAMEEAESAKNFLDRVQDVSCVLDRLEAWDREKEHPLAGRLDPSCVGMSGHSFGAVTTQAVSGQSYDLGGQRFTDARIRAAIAFSPSSPRRGDPAAAVDRYELLLHNAEHSAFTERTLPGDREVRNPNHHRAILALSTAFFDTHLRKDAAARAWLHGAGPRSILEKQDRWQIQAARKPDEE